MDNTKWLIRHHHKCGHTAAVRIDGPGKIAWHESRICDDCAKAQRLEKVQAQNQAKDRPALTGRERQISWAEQIRAKMLAEDAL